LSYTFGMMNTPVSTSIRKNPLTSAARSVADLLSEQIIDKLALGAQLPSESELALRFNVSRVTIREAFKILAGRGLVGLSRGKRAVVTQPDGAMFGAFLKSLIKSDPKCMFDLLQVRRSLEIQSVTFACRHASRTGLAAIEAALNAMRDAARAMPKDGFDAAADLAFDMADVQFHQALALAGGNRVLTYLFEAMESSLLEAFMASHRGQPNTADTLRLAYEEHRTIYEHLSARDERAATDAMLALLARAEVNLHASYGQP
jgi:GntR family transcriptional regulator, transcriptional repressor for pyruvate dehydrogenase complex